MKYNIKHMIIYCHYCTLQTLLTQYSRFTKYYSMQLLQLHWFISAFISRAFNYEFRPSVICKHLPWVDDGDNAEVKRNVNCDLYEMKGELKHQAVDSQHVTVFTGINIFIPEMSVWIQISAILKVFGFFLSLVESRVTSGEDCVINKRKLQNIKNDIII